MINKGNWIVILLLLVLVVANIYPIVSAHQEHQDRMKRAEQMLPLLEQQRQAINRFLGDYHTDVYDNPKIERIAEQQLIATEYQLLLLQTVAQQNTQILEFLFLPNR